jgi:hypothetical protein
MPRHWNFSWGQVLWWPRWRLAFWRGPYVSYRWIVYLWPVEIRRWSVRR